MICWALDFAAMMVLGDAERVPKSLAKKEILAVGGCLGGGLLGARDGGDDGLIAGVCRSSFRKQCGGQRDRSRWIPHACKRRQSIKSSSIASSPLRHAAPDRRSGRRRADRSRAAHRSEGRSCPPRRRGARNGTVGKSWLGRAKRAHEAGLPKVFLGRHVNGALSRLRGPRRPMSAAAAATGRGRGFLLPRCEAWLARRPEATTCEEPPSAKSPAPSVHSAGETQPHQAHLSHRGGAFLSPAGHR